MDHSGNFFVSSHPRLWQGVTHCWQTLPFKAQEPHILQACSIWNWLAANGFISLSELYIWMHGTFGHFVIGHCAFTASDIQVHFSAL